MTEVLAAELVAGILARAMETGTIFLLATLGEIYAERAGVLNLGVEGLMLVGGLAAFVAALVSGNWAIGLLVAVLVGAALSTVHGFLSITLRVNQVVSGLSLYVLGIGLSGFLGKSFVGLSVPRLPIVNVPSAQAALEGIPSVGVILSRFIFGHNPLVYISVGLAALMWFVLFKTRPGLNIRSVGENPSMADSLGVNVFSTRYIAVQIGGALAALAGAYFILGVIGVWTEGPAQQGQPITGGRGWIAIALVILGTWSPLRAILGAYLFGGVEAMQFTLQGLGFAGVSQFLAMLPYALAIFVLIAFSVEAVRKRIGVPAALGVPYAREA